MGKLDFLDLDLFILKSLKQQFDIFSKETSVITFSGSGWIWKKWVFMQIVIIHYNPMSNE